MGKMVTEAGFYDGKYRKAGQYHSGPGSDDLADEPEGDGKNKLNKMSKDELVAEAEKRGVELKANATKAEIIAALSA